jgi:hypothetical protein
MLSSIILAGVYFKYLKLIIVICFFYLYINVNVICVHYARCVWGRKRTIKERLYFTISSPLSGSLWAEAERIISVMIYALLTRLDSNIYLDNMIHEWLDRFPSIFEIDHKMFYFCTNCFLFLSSFYLNYIGK